MGAHSSTMKIVFLCFAALLATATAAPSAPKTENELLCSICVDVITDFDNWLTEDKTEQEIVDFVKEICHTLGQLIAGFEGICNSIVESQLPTIIDGLVNDYLNPEKVCTDILPACP